MSSNLSTILWFHITWNFDVKMEFFLLFYIYHTAKCSDNTMFFYILTVSIICIERDFIFEI